MRRSFSEFVKKDVTVIPVLALPTWRGRERRGEDHLNKEWGMNTMKKRLLVSCMILLAFLLVPLEASVVPASSAPEIKARVLKGVGSFRKDGTLGDSFDLFANKLKEKSKGALTLNWIGSSEAIPQADQPTAVKNGVIDFHFAAFSAYERALPITIGAPLNQYTPMEDRKNGVMNSGARPSKGLASVTSASPILRETITFS